MSRALTSAEMAAIDGINEGELEPLAAILALEGEIHPLVQRALRRIIDGPAGSTDYRLQVIRHPDLGNRQTNALWNKQDAVERDTALRMLRNGALTAGMMESAIAATIEQTGLSRRAIFSHWRKHKRYLLRGLDNKTIDAGILPGPIAERHWK
jgi:hypothetical protein